MLIRLRSLDGLRGLAALIVVIHHSLLVVPGLAAPYFGQSTQSSIQELLAYSPLHLLWAGTEAVFLFFRSLRDRSHKNGGRPRFLLGIVFSK
jgi:peptidoglycan/LPS O-acetylase OafA/YrhL